MPTKKKTTIKTLLPAKLKAPKPTDDLRAFRRALGLNQQDFWSRLGVTQSGGSRYENEQRLRLPPPVVILLDTIYVKGVILAQLTPRDFAILERLKKQHLDLYKRLDKSARRNK